VDSVIGLYTWSPWCPDDTAGIECWPMFWGDKSVSQWKSLVKPGYSHMGLGINEPNIASQSQMSASHAASLFREYQLPLRGKGYQFASPAPANGPSGISWIKEYKETCPECWDNTQFATAHYYSNNADNFIEYITQYHEAAGKDVIVTEIACQDFSGHNQQCSASEVRSFMKTVLEFVDKTPWLHAVCWFGMFHNDSSGVNKLNSLMDSTGKPNDLGELFLFG